jgi:hypothetical protein
MWFRALSIMCWTEERRDDFDRAGKEHEEETGRKRSQGLDGHSNEEYRIDE